MKILHIAPHCHESGNGVVNVAVDLACKQAESGHVVGFVSAGGSFVELLQLQNVGHFLLEQQYCRVDMLIKTLRNFHHILDGFSPNIVHAHMTPGALLARLLRNRFDFRLITTAHNGPHPTAVIMGVGDIVISVSTAVARAMHRLGIPASKLRVVRNGPLGSPRRPPLKGVGARTLIRRPAIVTVAGLFRHKGIGDLINAFSVLAFALPDVSLYVIGDGPARAEFQLQAATTHCADRIHFLGFVRDPRPFLLNADVFALVSHRESFGLAIAEAREAGCAIVATNVGGIPEALDDGKAGVLLPSRCPRALTEALISLFRGSNTLELWRQRSANNLGWLHVGRVAAETLAIYDEVLWHNRAACSDGLTDC